MDLAIGFRYHFIVFATTMNVPGIGLYSGMYYERKMRGFLRMMGLEKYAINIEKVEPLVLAFFRRVSLKKQT